MTFEKQCLIEASDIVAVHFECAHCRASMVVPISDIIAGGVSNYASDTAAKACQFCKTPWEISPNSEEHKVIVKFAQSVEMLAVKMEGRKLKLKLEIKCPQ